MVSLSPKRLRSRLMDRLGIGAPRHRSRLDFSGAPIPIFETTLAKATIASRLEHQPPAEENFVQAGTSSQSTTSPRFALLYRYWCPAVANRCLQYLALHGLDEEGLYRVPGSSETIKRLRHDFNCNGDVDLESFTPHEGQHELQVADVASLFKQFLRELAAPIMTSEMVSSLEAEMQTTATLRTLLSTKLQPYEFYMLSMLCTHLSAVDAHSSSNKMDIHNLSIVYCSSSNLGFGTNLFSALTRVEVWDGLRCVNEQSTIKQEQEALTLQSPA